MEAGTGWCSDAVQRMWTSLRQIDPQKHDEAIARLQRFIIATEINGRCFSEAAMKIYNERVLVSNFVYTLLPLMCYPHSEQIG